MVTWDVHFHTASDASVTESGNEVKFEIKKSGLGIREYVFESSGKYSPSEYLIFDYEAFGIIRCHELRAAFMLGKAEGQNEYSPLCILNDVVIDGKRHTMTVKTPVDTEYSSIRIVFRVQSTHAYFKLYGISSCGKEDIPVRFGTFRSDIAAEGFRTADLSKYYNSAAPDECVLTDSGTGMPDGDTILKNIPFSFGRTERNIIKPEAPPAENDDIILNFGIPAKRGKCRPVSRDSEISLEIGDTAEEIVFCAVMSGNLHERWGYCAKDPTILGAAIGEVMMPLTVKDVERFMVEIVYDDGTHDTAFPYNINLGRHVMVGETGIYAVPVLPKKIGRIVFHNRMIETDISIAAVTLNISAQPLIPRKSNLSSRGSLTVDENPGSQSSGSISRDNDRLIIDSGNAELVLKVSDGLKIESISNRCAEKSSVRGSLLKLRTADRGITDSFVSVIKNYDSSEAEIECTYENLILNLKISTGERGVILLKLKAENTGVSDISVGIMFPVLDDVRFDGWDDGWYMFPKYQNALGNGHICVYEESAPSFPMQFFDLFSPSQNGGIGVLTKELNPVVRKYAMEKNDDCISAFVEYPSMYMSLKPGDSFCASETEIYIHNGDWHSTFNRYRGWLKTWYKPYKCQDKAWYRSLFWLTAEITDFYETEDFFRLPPWYNDSDGSYNFRKIMDEQKEIYGVYPDILHLWGWCYDTEHECNQWGHYGKEDYDRLGGLDNLKNALKKCSEETGAEISLYLHPTLLTSRYPEAGEYQPELMVRNSGGGAIGLEGAYRMCHANETWRNHSLETYRRVIGETDFRIYYVDEFGLRVENRCYAENHGHSVPSNLLLTDREYISRLREKIDGDTVLYGEYAAADINAGYIDCNISYHILDSIRDMIETSWIENDDDDTRGRVFTNLYRFAFPKIVQLVLPMAMRFLSWQPLKSTFFNAEAIYDSFWDAEESRGREFMSKAYSIKKKYADCYISDEPDTMLPSPAVGVFINRFPGKTRTMYNLYNSGYYTQRGVVLALTYSENTVYYDVWNDCKCRTERQGDTIYVYGNIDAQDVGCIVAESVN